MRQITRRINNTRTATTTELNSHLANHSVTKSRNDTNAESESRLLKLPPEIREHIWRDLLTSSTGFVKIIWGDRKTGNDEEPMIEFHFHATNNAFHSFTGERIHLSIFFTKDIQLYHECAYTFWRANTFILEPLNPRGFPQSLDLSKENCLSTSFYRKIEHVQLNYNLSINELLLFPNDYFSRREDIRTALAALEKMADSEQGFLKSITVKPLGSLVDLEIALYSISASPRFLQNYNTILDFFGDFNERGNVAGVKRKVEVELSWNGKTYDEQQRFKSQYQPQAMFMLSELADDMGGSNSELWVDGKLCLAYVEGKRQAGADPFSMKSLEKEEEEESDS